MKFYYAHIDTATNLCVGILGSLRKMNKVYLVEIPGENAAYIGLYFYDGMWWERVWNQYETIKHTTEDGTTWEETVPVESAGYVDHPYTPGGNA